VILTTQEAADELRVTPFAIRKMVERGELVPISKGARPLRFALLAVAEAQYRRISPTETATLDTLADRLTCIPDEDLSR